MDKLFIFRFNGNGIEAIDCLSPQYQLVGFIDDTIEKQGVNHLGFRVFARSILKECPQVKVLAVSGSPLSYRSRPAIIGDLKIPEELFATVIHRSANVSQYAKIGTNVLIMAGVVITSNAVIEDHVCILPNSTIHHDVTIKKYSLIGSNVSIAGGVTIGENCYIGSGTRLINSISVGDRALIGLGSNVLKNVDSENKIAGNPARVLP
jgi:sugar O-acyltransferase (sialic acid O-acetyltransferase NeuD family)